MGRPMVWWSALAGTLAIAALAFWGLAAFNVRKSWRLTPVLASMPDQPPPGGWPMVAAVIDSSDDRRWVESGTHSLLAEDLPGLVVVSLDPRAAIATGAILDRLAAAEPRLLVVRSAATPDRWLSKLHGLQSASDAAIAAGVEWLLFTDPDVVLAPGSVRRAVSFADRVGADQLLAVPQVVTRGLEERLVLEFSRLVAAVLTPPWKVDDRRSRAMLGVGAFRLVRAETFRDIGGFGRVRLSVDIDRQFGRALKAAGARTRVLDGTGAVHVRPRPGRSGVTRRLERSAFATLNDSTLRVVLSISAVLILGLAPVVGLAVGPIFSRLACLLAIAAVTLVSGTSLLTIPVGSILFAWSLGRSAWRTLRRGGIRRRGEVVSLADLRYHIRGRERWLGEVWKGTRTL
ncbi:hypothetical protein EP7_001653 [Isosphaeraceae bacterium EP7]